MTNYNAPVRQAWKDFVFANINGGLNSFDYNLWVETRKKRATTLLNGKVDFWLYDVRHKVDLKMMGGEDRIFEVEVVRVKENELDNGVDLILIDDFNDTLYELVKTNLGDTWQGSVDFWSPPEEMTQVKKIEFGDRECFEARVIYTATKFLTY